jgi:hypothetical protein
MVFIPESTHSEKVILVLSSKNWRERTSSYINEKQLLRTRSYEKELEQEPLAKADSQIDSQALRDPDLARVVTAWPGLAPALKAAVLAITDSTKT